MREIGPGGLALLGEFEQGPDGGPAHEPYDAHDGKRTTGLGHVITGDEPFDCSGWISDAQIAELQRLDTAAAAREVETHVAVKLTDNQFDALVCFTFNIGRHGFDTSTLLRELNAGDLDDVPAQMMRWDKVGGVELAGLKRRRAAEVALWCAP